MLMRFRFCLFLVVLCSSCARHHLALPKDASSGRNVLRAQSARSRSSVSSLLCLTPEPQGTMHLRGGVRPARGSADADADPETTQAVTDLPDLSEIDLPDSEEDAEGIEHLRLETKNPLEEEFVQSMDDKIDSEMEPFLGDSDFMQEDGWDLAGARVYQPESPLMTDSDADEDRPHLIVPDMLESIPAAVRAAELTQRDKQHVPLVFVRSGEYRWSSTIVLVQKHELDVPPFAEVQPGMINNSSTHWKFESPVPTENSTLKSVRLRLTGETGALLWGSWHLDKGSSAAIAMLQLLTDAGDLAQPPTLCITNGLLLIESCGIRSVGGMCLQVGEASEVEVRDCQLGGLGMLDSERAWVGASVWDSSNLSISSSSFTQGLQHCPALRACDQASLEARHVTVLDYGFGVSISHSSSVLLADSSLTNLSFGAVSCVDPNSGDGGARAAAPRPRLRLVRNVLVCRLWASGTLPEVVENVGNSVLGEHKTLEEEAEEAERDEAELEDMLAELDKLGNPAEWYAQVKDAPSDREQARVMEGIAHKLDCATKIAEASSLLDTSRPDVKHQLQTQGLMDEAAAADLMLAPYQASPNSDPKAAEADRLLLDSAPTSDSSFEDKNQESVAAKQRRALEAMEMSFLMYQRFYERLPERLKQNQEEAQLYAQMPEALSNLREDRRACFPDEDE